MGILLAPKAFCDVARNEIGLLERKLNWLWINRKIISHLALHGDMKDFFKRKVGKYRIIYTYDEEQDEMIIHLIGNRDSIYKSKS
jgi:mRNA-degrading endonuclease RelE of RelBE toxin-antitoxin system